MRIWQVVYNGRYSEIAFGNSESEIWGKYPGAVAVYEVFIH